MRGYRSVVLSLKPTGVAPGDATAEQLERVAEWAERFGFGEIRVSHEQHLILPDVRVDQLHALWHEAKSAGLATPNAGLLTDIIACPGGDFCSLANAKSIPIAESIQRRFDDLDYVHDLGEININISGCISARARMRHPVSTHVHDECGGTVFSGIVGESIDPQSPQHADPSAREDADGMGMITAAGASAAVHGCGPDAGVARVISQTSDSASQAMIAGPTKGDAAGLAGLVRHGCDASFSGELRATGDVLIDQLFFLRRVGFSSFVLRADQDRERAIDALRTFSDAYQSAADQPLPAFRRHARPDARTVSP